MRQSHKWYLLCSLMLNFFCVYAANEETVKEDFGDPTPEHTIDMSGFSRILAMVNRDISNPHSYFLNSDTEIVTREITTDGFSGIDSTE